MLLQVAGLLACLLLIDVIGRRRCLLLFLAASVVAFAPFLRSGGPKGPASGEATEEVATVDVAMLFVSRLTTYASFIVVFIYTPEVRFRLEPSLSRPDRACGHLIIQVTTRPVRRLGGLTGLARGRVVCVAPTHMAGSDLVAAPQVYPTRVRSFAFGIFNAISRLGGLIAPFVGVDLFENVRLPLRPLP